MGVSLLYLVGAGLRWGYALSLPGPAFYTDHRTLPTMAAWFASPKGAEYNRTMNPVLTQAPAVLNGEAAPVAAGVGARQLVLVANSPGEVSYLAIPMARAAR